MTEGCDAGQEERSEQLRVRREEDTGDFVAPSFHDTSRGNSLDQGLDR